MTSDSADARSRAPAPPAITRVVAEANMGGGLMPPFLPGHGAAAGYAGDAAADEETGDWPELPDDGAAVPAWDDGDGGEDEDRGDGATSGAAGTGSAEEFPLDAFFVPEHARSVPTGYDDVAHRAMADRVASRLEEMARQVREQGVGALGAASTDELTRLIAAVVGGFFAREQ